MASPFTRFLDHTQRRTTVGRTPPDELSAPRRDLYLTTHNTHNRQTSMLPLGFEPTISAGERPQTYVLDRAATATGELIHESLIFFPQLDKLQKQLYPLGKSPCSHWTGAWMYLRIALNTVTNPVDFPRALIFWDTALSLWLGLAFKYKLLTLLHPSQSSHIPPLL